MKQRTVWVTTIFSLLALFLGTAIVYEIKATQELKAAEQALHLSQQELASAKTIKVDETLVNKPVYQARTAEFFKRAVMMATSTESQLTKRSSKDETYGTPEAYEAVQSLAGMASSLTVKDLRLTFNEQSDGSVVGAGALTIDTAAQADDSTGKLMHDTSDYTALVTLDKVQSKWRVSELKLGQVTPGENANDTIY